jgi:hypothetical protein
MLLMQRTAEDFRPKKNQQENKPPEPIKAAAVRIKI